MGKTRAEPVGLAVLVDFDEWSRMPLERRRVYYSGRVQGVGFRITSQQLARSFEVVGFVRNLDDGRVELVAEGETTELDSFLNTILDTFGEQIQAARTESLSLGVPELQGFTIRETHYGS